MLKTDVEQSSYNLLGVGPMEKQSREYGFDYI